MRPTLLYSIIFSLVSFPLTLKYVTLNDLEWLKGHFTLYVHYYERPLTNYLLLIYCSLFITCDVTSGEVQEAEYSKQ